jgi:hypothetical protein
MTMCPRAQRLVTSPAPAGPFRRQSGRSGFLCLRTGLLAGLLAALSAPAAPLERTVAEHGVTLTLRAEPGTLDLTRDVVLTLRAEAPETATVRFPALDDRLSGFILKGVYDEEAVVRDGVQVLERRARLTPLLAAEHRVAPMAVAVAAGAQPGDPPQWVFAPPLVFAVRPVFDGDPGDTVAAGITPLWIRPPFRSVAFRAGAVLLGLLALWGLARLLACLRRRVRLARLSPRERALTELAALLARDLPGRNRVKDFYCELTLIVRRYIERAHGLRAPEQTTAEFLAAAGHDPRFGPATLDRLRAFLEAADLVKFAAYHPEPGAVSQAADTARDYIEHDQPPAA